jgi:hypothetical protein
MEPSSQGLRFCVPSTTFLLLAKVSVLSRNFARLGNGIFLRSHPVGPPYARNGMLHIDVFVLLRVDCNEMYPPMSSTGCRQIVQPNSVPPCGFLVELSVG